jgi:hypothetical protein
MQKILFSFAFLISTQSFAQQPVLISQIAECVLNSAEETDEKACFQNHLAVKIDLNEIIGTWVFLNEKGLNSKSQNPNIIVPVGDDTDCTVYMAFNLQNAGQSKTCPPDSSLIANSTALGIFTHKFPQPEVLELEKTRDAQANSFSSALCSLVKLDESKYLICKSTVEETPIKTVATFKKRA